MSIKERFPVGTNVVIEDLKRVVLGKELRGVKHCYHIEMNYHPTCPTRIPLTDTGAHMKLRIIDWIKVGKIYIDK